MVFCRLSSAFSWLLLYKSAQLTISVALNGSLLFMDFRAVATYILKNLFSIHKLCYGYFMNL